MMINVVQFKMMFNDNQLCSMMFNDVQFRMMFYIKHVHVKENKWKEVHGERWSSVQTKAFSYRKRTTYVRTEHDSVRTKAFSNQKRRTYIRTDHKSQRTKAFSHRQSQPCTEKIDFHTPYGQSRRPYGQSISSQK